MSSPCPKCGAIKTEAVRHGIVYNLAWAFGYRLRECSGCRKPRLIRRHDESPDSLKLGKKAVTVARFGEERGALKTAEENLEAKVTEEVAAADSADYGLRCCPFCGSTQYHRTPRTTLEHLLLRPRMARCETCRLRFPYPRHRDGCTGSVNLGEAAATVASPSEEKRGPEMAEEHVRPTVSKQVTGADSSNRGLRGCPVCGSTSYRRSRRTTLERILLRPKMARCRNCRKRFPYPKS
jgi:hypothetical protein